MVLVPSGELLGRFVVEWFPSEERTSHKRIRMTGNGFLFRVNQPGLGGFYYPLAFPIVIVPVFPIVNLIQESTLNPVFNVGDRVIIDPAMKTSEIVMKLEQTDAGGGLVRHEIIQDIIQVLIDFLND